LAAIAIGTYGSRVPVPCLNDSLGTPGPSRATEEPPPPSRPSPRPISAASLWGIDWDALLPLRVTSDVVARRSSYEECLPFVRDHYAAIFQEDAASPFSTSRHTPAKERYYRLSGDFFEFVAADRTVGLLVCTPVDWSSYYVRSAAVLPEYSGRKLIQRFLPSLFEALARAGVERVEADTSPSNMATMHLLTRLRFNVTGTVLTERWGAHVHFTRFLDEASEHVFLRQFCSGVRYQERDRNEVALATRNPQERSSP
jgi:hypothetical protein